MMVAEKEIVGRHSASEETLSLLRRVEEHLSRHIEAVGGTAAAPTTAELLGDVRAVLA